MKKYQQELDNWFRGNGWEYWSPHEILVRLMEETGELARLVNHLYGPKKKRTANRNKTLMKKLAI